MCSSPAPSIERSAIATALISSRPSVGDKPADPPNRTL